MEIEKRIGKFKVVAEFNQKNIFSGYLVTTVFNFASISLLLYAFSTTSLKATTVTLCAHILGMFMSMYFSMDFWWTKVTHEMVRPIKFKQRAHFLLIASVTALVSWMAVGAISHHNSVSASLLIVTNWIAIGSISIIKYVLFIFFVY